MDTLKFAKQLRKNQTASENELWKHLRNRQLNGVKFKRQHPIDNYIVDFVSYEHKMIIELDGGQHNDTSYIEADKMRTVYLNKQGYKVLRFWDHEVFENIEGVIQMIEGNLVNS